MKAVLLAEDDSVSRQFLSAALRASGLDCEAVEDGGRALQRARATRYDLLLLDVNLPHLSGPSILAQLRAEPEAASHMTPALALTADHRPELQRQLLAAGFAAVANKPIGIDRLQAVLQSVLAGSSAPDEPSASDAPWDDAGALRAAGGRREIVQALRELMLQELPQQRARIVAALERRDEIAMEADLHRLRAACGFCGAAQLSAGIERLQQMRPLDLGGEASRNFLAAVDRLLRESAPPA
jgi:CheY-like chemotaxis protein/HPt (histidine-containing phosphotransfer) domain-containing protein